MKCAVVVVFVVMCWPLVHARAVKRSSGTTICSASTPCGWEIYNPNTRSSDFFVNSPCQCREGTQCRRWNDDISIAAYVFRCSDTDTATPFGH